MNATALHLLTAARVRQAETDLVLREQIATSQVIVIDAAMTRQPEYAKLRTLNPTATLLASINARALYGQGPENQFYVDFRNKFYAAAAKLSADSIVWSGPIFCKDAATDPSLGPELVPSLRTAEVLADIVREMFPTDVDIYLDDSFRNGYPPRDVALASRYGKWSVFAWRAYCEHLALCLAARSFTTWGNTASAEGFRGMHNCCEVGSRVAWAELVKAAAKSERLPWICWNYTEPGIHGLLLKGEVLDA